MASDNNQGKNIDDPKIWKESGNEFFNSGHYEEAVKCYAHALELDPAYIDAWNNMGYALLKLGRIEQARQCNEKVKELKAKSTVISHPVPKEHTDYFQTPPSSEREFCPYCRRELPFSTQQWPYGSPILCPSCGMQIQDGASNEIPGAQGQPQQSPLKNPILAAILSLFPGLGQIYNGQIGKACLFFFGVILGLLLIIPGIVIWIYGMYQAYKTAHHINNGEIPYKKSNVFLMIVYVVVTVFATFFVVMFLLTFSGMAPVIFNENYNPLNLSTDQITSSAIVVPYDDLYRSNEKYVGKIVYYKGKILQSQNIHGDFYVYLIATKKTQYGYDYLDDIIWVNYRAPPRYIDEDIIEVWGQVKGLKTYPTNVGVQQTKPEINAMYTNILPQEADQSTTVQEMPTAYPIQPYTVVQTTQTPSPNPAEIKITSRTQWRGSFGDSNTNREVSESGSAGYYINNPEGIIYVSIRKTLSDDAILKVDIIHEGKILHSGETTQPYGYVTISAKV